MPYSVLTAVTGQTSPDMKSGIEYYVQTLPGQVTQNHDPQTGSTTVNCVVDYGDVDLFIHEMLGYAEKSGDRITRVLPESCPWNTAQYALKASVTQYINHIDNDSKGWPIYELAVVQVTFGAPLYKVLEDDEVEYEFDRFVVWTTKNVPTNEKIPGGSMVFSDGVPLGEVPVKTGRVKEIEAKWIDVPGFNSNWNGWQNKVNANTVTFDGQTYAPETVLFSGYQEVRRVTSYGYLVADIIFKLDARVDGRTWNQFWRRNSTGALIYDTPTDSLSNKLFETFAMKDLFKLTDERT